MFALACALHAYLLIPQYHVVDLAPVGNLPKSKLDHTLRFIGTSAGDRRIGFDVRFPADKTPTEVRDIAFERIKSTTLGVKKLGDTKVMIFGCRMLDIKTMTLLNKEFPENCRPVLDLCISGKPIPRLPSK